MSGIEYGLLAFAFLLVLLALRVHIAVAMLITGITGYVSLVGWTPLLAYLKNAAFARYSVYDLAVVPLFLLMGQFALRGGLSKGLFDAANTFVGHWRGGIAMGAVGACAGFGAICGSSLATAATMGQVALPELRRHGYAPGLATGALPAGGTLGVLIPTLGGVGDLRHPDRAEHRPTVHRRPGPRHPRGDRLHAHDHGVRADQPHRRPGRCPHPVVWPPAGAAADLARAGDLRDRDGRFGIMMLMLVDRGTDHASGGHERLRRWTTSPATCPSTPPSAASCPS